MKTLTTLFSIAIVAFISCSKDKMAPPDKSNQPQQIIPIPNGDFENWINGVTLTDWKTNSCPWCVPPYNTYIVQRDSNAYHGQFAARFIYNNVYPAWAENTFSITNHPSSLKAYVKCNLYGTDTVLVKIRLMLNSTPVDSGQWMGTTSIFNYTQITIPITQSISQADSAEIRIQGGNKMGYPNPNTEFWVDHLILQ